MFKNLESFKRFNIIKNKNMGTYDSFIGAVSMAFFPINIIVCPFIIPILLVRSKRINDFFLKLQYMMMVVIYSALAGGTLVCLSPLLLVKMMGNSIYILVYNKREKYPYENITQFFVSLLLSPFIISVSIMVDFFNLPKILF